MQPFIVITPEVEINQLTLFQALHFYVKAIMSPLENLGLDGDLIA